MVFTVGADNVRGSAQVFDNSLTLAFGTYPLQVIPTTGSVPPDGGGKSAKVTAATEDPAAFAESLEAALMEYDQYKDRFEQVESEQVDSDTPD